MNDNCIILDESYNGCFIGGLCQFYTKSIGITLDDLLRDEIKPYISLSNQSSLVQISTAITIVMFIGGLINSILSLLTFQNKDLRKVGCGMYLLASSITSLTTLCMFTIKFWFILLTQINISTNYSILRGGCVFIEPILKLCLYLDSWLNACVAIERTINVAKGVTFDKKKSTLIAQWIILILPFCVMSTIIHDPLYRELFVYNTEKIKMIGNRTDKFNTSQHYTFRNEYNNTYGKETNGNKAESYFWCITRYSHSIQTYNTAILFIHLVAPFIINLASALFIIFGIARKRSVAQTKQTYKEHLFGQFNEHKQLIISPIILLILSLPRLVIALLSGCTKITRNPWLYLVGYFISFTPSMLIFIIFVLPSDLYRKTFKQSLITFQ